MLQQFSRKNELYPSQCFASSFKNFWHDNAEINKWTYKNKLFYYLCGCRKGFRTQYALLSLIERWKKILDEKGFGGAVLMDLSKAFDTLNHELLIAKLSAYGFNNESLKLIRSYLTNRWQRTKINKSFSRWTELLQGVPQGPVLGSPLFNIYLNNLFFLVDYTDVCNFADDTTLFACDKDSKWNYE